MTQTSKDRAHALIAEAPGFINVEDFANRGVNRVTIRELVADGALSNPAWGIYVGTEQYARMSSHRDWALLSYKYPDAVFCLKSAAMFHGMTQEVHGSLTFFSPRAYGDSPKMGAQFMTPMEPMVTRKEANLRFGVETYDVDGVSIRVTSRERTLVDFFRYSREGNEGRALVTMEMLYDLVQRMSGEDTSFDFDKTAALSMDFGCFEQLGRVTMPFRFRSQAIGFIS
ncbi:type IV toxin-antitoxin system AbiEi family antitoxin domain-containing protein [Agrobacterium rubi]|nr:type IV toxin-antitoxin system AbiEi family antitoxin domain-containing protein [Agrobacterium rubi]NTF24471.1 type IV toxin-antitoxin system AbiEi family antitoxin domain-containing protein [Agrobacterium rubi]